MQGTVLGSCSTIESMSWGRRALLVLLTALTLVVAPLTVPAFAATPIATEYQRLGGTAGRLGPAVSPEVCGIRDGGCYQRFRGGDIHWSAKTGARATWGAVKRAWAALGYERGRLGYPTGGESCGLRDGGCSQSFQGGNVVWSQATGGRPIWGGIRARWMREGAEHGALGYPITAEKCSGGACRQAFQRGAITWTAGSGARAVREVDRAASLYVVVNKRRQLSPTSYVPDNLVDVGNDQLLRSDAAAAFRRMQADSGAADVPLIADSGYRSYDYQVDLHQYYLNLHGPELAVLYSLRPGHSEHQTGLAVDVGNADGTCAVDFTCFQDTPGGVWAKNNAHKYGFIVRYPEGQTATTGLNYEGWHLRYVGTAISTGMVEQGIPTLEHYMGLPAAPTY